MSCNGSVAPERSANRPMRAFTSRLSFATARAVTPVVSLLALHGFGHVPELDPPHPPAGGQSLAIRAERDTAHPVGVRLELGELLAGRHVPQPDHPPFAPRGQNLP